MTRQQRGFVTPRLFYILSEKYYLTYDSRIPIYITSLYTYSLQNDTPYQTLCHANLATTLLSECCIISFKLEFYLFFSFACSRLSMIQQFDYLAPDYCSMSLKSHLSTQQIIITAQVFNYGRVLYCEKEPIKKSYKDPTKNMQVWLLES